MSQMEEKRNIISFENDVLMTEPKITRQDERKIGRECRGVCKNMMQRSHAKV